MWIDINEAVTILKTSRRTLDRQPERQIEELKMQLEQLNEDNRQLAASNCQLAAKIEKMSDDAVEASKRHDVIVMRLADQIEAQRLQLEEAQRPRPLLNRLKAIFIPSST